MIRAFLGRSCASATTIRKGRQRDVMAKCIVLVRTARDPCVRMPLFALRWCNVLRRARFRHADHAPGVERRARGDRRLQHRFLTLAGGQCPASAGLAAGGPGLGRWSTGGSVAAGQRRHGAAAGAPRPASLQRRRGMLRRSLAEPARGRRLAAGGAPRRRGSRRRPGIAAAVGDFGLPQGPRARTAQPAGRAEGRGTVAGTPHRSRWRQWQRARTGVDRRLRRARMRQ